ncbi:hypothetical protein GGE65_008262 [Skermanella aerolata]|uniref:hypothetical protein n=1 Tax=Skermanella aerolata TaxID=393310 RepID=UPI003D1989A5
MPTAKTAIWDLRRSLESERPILDGNADHRLSGGQLGLQGTRTGQVRDAGSGTRRRRDAYPGRNAAMIPKRVAMLARTAAISPSTPPAR